MPCTPPKRPHPGPHMQALAHVRACLACLHNARAQARLRAPRPQTISPLPPPLAQAAALRDQYLARMRERAAAARARSAERRAAAHVRAAGRQQQLLERAKQAVLDGDAAGTSSAAADPERWLDVEAVAAAQAEVMEAELRARAQAEAAARAEAAVKAKAKAEADARAKAEAEARAAAEAEAKAEAEARTRERTKAKASVRAKAEAEARAAAMAKAQAKAKAEAEAEARAKAEAEAKAKADADAKIMAEEAKARAEAEAKAQAEAKAEAEGARAVSEAQAAAASDAEARVSAALDRAVARVDSWQQLQQLLVAYGHRMRPCHVAASLARLPGLLDSSPRLGYRRRADVAELVEALAGGVEAAAGAGELGVAQLAECLAATVQVWVWGGGRGGGAEGGRGRVEGIWGILEGFDQRVWKQLARCLAAAGHGARGGCTGGTERAWGIAFFTFACLHSVGLMFQMEWLACCSKLYRSVPPTFAVA
eukprot:359694-Chlamydomonas_euryale.AAC.4